MVLGLMQRRYYDVAIDYLESLGQAAKCPDDLKNQVDLQIALVHLEALSQGKAPLGVEVHFVQARNALTRFLKERPDSEEAYLANRCLGKLLLEELRQLTVRIHAPGTTAAQQESFRDQAEEKYAEAENLFQQAERIAYNTAKTLRDDPSVKSNPGKAVKLDAAYMQVLEARVQLAGLPRERAKIYERGSAEYQRSMEEAAFLCKAVVQKYANYTGSLDAKLLEAKSYFDLGKYREARILVTELNVLNPTTPQFRAILAEAFPLMLELNLQEPTAENLVDSLERILRWADSTTPDQRNDPFYAKANLLAGSTYLKLLHDEKNGDSKNARQYRSCAMEYLHSVAAGSPESQKALILLAPLSETSSHAVTPGEPLESPASWGDARQQVERKFQEFLLAERMFSTATDSREKKQRESYRNQVAEQAIHILRAASDFDGIDASDRNTMRMKLATVYWSLNRWEEVIVIGDYLMKHYAATSFGPQGADISIKAARRLFLEDLSQTTPERKVDPAMYRRIEKTYNTIIARWEAFPVGQEAISLRIETELDLGSLDQAKKFLETIPADSDRRHAAELKFGCAIWALFVKNLAAGPPQPTSDLLSGDLLPGEAKFFLEKGLEGKRSAPSSGAAIDFATVSACLVLAQIELIQKNPQAAQAILNDPDFGPLTLFNREREQTGTSPVFGSPDWNETFKMQIVTVALRSALDARQDDRVKILLESFDSRKTDLDATTLLWLADTYYRLGDDMTASLTDGVIEPVPPPEQAVAYFEQAESLYRDMLDNPGSPDVPLRFKLALAKRGQGKYGDAYEILTTLIGESENQPSVQIEAARTLQLWGQADKEFYVRAIVGDLKKSDGQYAVWGWQGIISRTSRNFEKNKSEFFEAHFNKAVCRILLARKLGGQDAKKLLDGAKNDLNYVQQLHPNFGGEPWASRFKKLELR